MEEHLHLARALPLAASIPVAGLMTLLLLHTLRTARGRATRFVVFAIWLRFILSAFSVFTFRPSPVGLSWNGLGSVAIVGIGLLVLKPRRAIEPGVVFFYPIMAAVIASGFANDAIAGMIDMLVKYTYLAVLSLAIADAIAEDGWDRALGRMFLPSLVPLVFQAVSLALGVAKASEADGTASYIGGFNHEAAFSVGLASGVVMLALRTTMRPGRKTVLIALFGAGLFLANYRTAILGLLPVLAAVAVIGAWRNFVPTQRAFVTAMMAVLVGMAGLGAAVTQQERFADIGIVVTQGTNLIKPPREFTIADRQVMSARPLIWSMYLYGYAEGTPLQHLVGLGPNSWEGVMGVYAHNTLVSALYELGVLGVVATLTLWAGMIGLALMADRRHRAILLMAHISFLILNMATMPMWMIEGLIVYGLLCGCTIAAYAERKRGRTPVDQRAPTWRTKGLMPVNPII